MYEDHNNGQTQDLLHTDNLIPLKLNESWAGRRLLEALRHLPPNDLSSSLNLKFQQKQMLEREQKKLALIGGDYSHTSKKSEIGNGKVRQMFDDRRRGVGIDRSHPLRPIVASTSPTSVTTSNSTQQAAINKRLIGKVAERSGLNNSSSIKTTASARLKSNLSVSNGNINIFQNNFDELDNIDNETFPKEFSSLSLSNTHVIGSLVTNDYENNNGNESNSLADTITINNNKKTGSKTNGIKLNPVITKKSPTTPAVPKTTSRTISSSSRAFTIPKSASNTVKSPPTKVSLLNKAEKKSYKPASNKTFNAKPATFVLSVKPPPRISTPPPGMASCQHCQRHFSEERLEKHEEVCRKMMSKKRKIFDASKHRVKGTEAEKYIKKGKNLNPIPAHSTAQVAKNSGEKKSNWRKKHEEFISAIREAKKVQAYLAKGGKLSDLPPPPPSENPDYIQCPHCSRRFNESAAERHIPKCANMQHNKPKSIKKRF